jgi:hypothetical protein
VRFEDYPAFVALLHFLNSLLQVFQRTQLNTILEYLVVAQDLIFALRVELSTHDSTSEHGGFLLATS